MTLRPEEREVCARCFDSWPRTEEYWPPSPRSLDGLSTWCRACRADLAKRYYRAKKVSR